MATNTTLQAAPAVQTPLSVRLTSMVGWIMLGCGVGVLLYLVYALLFTNVGAERAQGALREQWQQQVATAPDDAAQAEPAADDADAGAELAGEEPQTGIGAEAVVASTAPVGEAVALISFERPGSDRPLIHEEPLVVLDSVDADDLARGPGHYPDSAKPGRKGNFAVAGHRTTYGAPFFHLDRLRKGDRINVTDRKGRNHVYEVVEQHVVLPGDTWVIADDPLGNGRRTMTLTTCHPRFSAAQRLVVHAELIS